MWHRSWELTKNSNHGERLLVVEPVDDPRYLLSGAWRFGLGRSTCAGLVPFGSGLGVGSSVRGCLVWGGSCSTIHLELDRAMTQCPVC